MDEVRRATVEKWVDRVFALFWLVLVTFASVAAFGAGERHGVIWPWLALFFLYAGQHEAESYKKLAQSAIRLLGLVQARS